MPLKESMKKSSTKSTAAEIAETKKKLAALEKKHAQEVESKRSKALDKIIALAAESGLTAVDITKALNKSTPTKRKARSSSNSASSHKGSKVPPKYRNPDNAEQTWTGRGRTPVWALKFATENRLEEILIQKPQAA